MTAGLIELSSGLQPRPWADNLVSPVLFSDAFEDIIDRVDPVVEVDPHSTLSGSIRQILKDRSLAYVSCLRRTDAVNAMRDLACELVRLGYPVSLRSVNSIAKTTTPTFVPDLQIILGIIQDAIGSNHASTGTFDKSGFHRMSS